MGIGLDKISEDRIKLLHPKIVSIAMEAYAVAFSRLNGNAFPRITQGLRTFAEQQALYNQGRTTKGPIVTHAKAGQGFHNYGLAVDFCLIVNGKQAIWNETEDFDKDLMPDWLEVVDSFKRQGFKWGGDWSGKKRDSPHFEMTFGYTWRQLLDKHNKKDFIPGTTYVRI